jgi:tetratricopeptide (TPR) repeat protein
MNLEKLKDTARKYEQKEDWRRAIDVYLKAIAEFESGKEPHPDLSLYNRVGDLYIKVNDPAAAVRSYERAADLYTEQGFLNNAIALCGKILRINPGRVQTYYKLAQIHARKNMLLEAKRNLIEYLERMNHAGELDAAFEAVKVFADHFPANQEIRMMLIDLLRAASREEEARAQVEKVAADLESRGDEVGAQRTREQVAEQAEARAGSSRAGDLVFLDVGLSVPASPPATSVPRSPSITPAAPPGIAFLDAEAAGEVAAESALETGPTIDDADVEVLEGLMQDELATPADLAPPEIDIMLEPAFGEGEDDEPPVDARVDGLEVMEAPTDVASPAGFEPMDTFGEELPDELEPIGDPVGAEVFADPEEGEPAGDEELAVSLVDEFAEAPAPVDVASIDDLEDRILEDPDNPDLHRRLGEALLLQGETGRATDEFELALLGYEGYEQREPAEELIALLITLHPESVRYYQKRVEYAYRNGERDQLLNAYLDLGDALVRAQAEDKAAAVYGRVLEHEPHNARARYALEQMGLLEPEASESQVEAGGADVDDSEWSVDAADEVTGPAAVVVDDADEALWTEEDLVPPPALDVAVDEAGDAAAELDVVTEAAMETEPDADAQDALDAFEGIQVIEAPVAEPEPPAAVAAPTESAPAAPAPPAAPVRPASGDPLDFVDLGALIMEEESPRDSRMKGEQLETTGDEQRDFEEMLAQFKKGIDENLSHDDYEAHYDLGVAFKEMGLLDEAIAEFQKALRAPESRLRTSEALGVAFYEKGQYPVSEAVLRRAVDTLSGGDDSKIGLIYWLGRSCEAQGKDPEARAHYERAMAQDIRFMDLQDRMKRLAPARR